VAKGGEQAQSLQSLAISRQAEREALGPKSVAGFQLRNVLVSGPRKMAGPIGARARSAS
jgi:hypothetical protein